MSRREETESGYIGTPDIDRYTGSDIQDVEVIRLTKNNVIARGCRYGRQWFLKGLREELRDSYRMQRQLQKEFEIHSRLRHPSVVQVVGLENINGLGLCIVQISVPVNMSGSSGILPGYVKLNIWETSTGK